MQIIGDSTTLALPTDQRNADRWFNTGVFNTNSSQVLANNIRTFPFRFSNVRLDRQRRLDLSLNKTFPIRERFRMRFRADVFNVENTPVLRGPNTDPVNGAFGRITAQEPPRSFQFSLNMQFSQTTWMAAQSAAIHPTSENPVRIDGPCPSAYSCLTDKRK